MRSDNLDIHLAYNAQEINEIAFISDDIHGRSDCDFGQNHSEKGGRKGRPKKAPVLPLSVPQDFDQISASIIAIAATNLWPAVRQRARSNTTRERGFAPVAREVIYFLIDHINTSKGFDWHGAQGIANKINVSIDAVDSGIRELRNAGYILRRKRSGQTSQTTLPVLLAAYEEVIAEVKVPYKKYKSNLLLVDEVADKKSIHSPLKIPPNTSIELEKEHTEERGGGFLSQTASEDQHYDQQSPMVADSTTFQRANPSNTISKEARNEARKLAPGWCISALEKQWREWSDDRDEDVRDADRAFIGFCKRRGPMKGSTDKAASAPTGLPVPPELVARPDEIAVSRNSAAWTRWLIYTEKRDRQLADRMRGVFVVFVAREPGSNPPLPRVPFLPPPTASTGKIKFTSGPAMLTPKDPEWSAWLEHWKSKDRDDLVGDARDAGRITVPSRWPAKTDQSVDRANAA